MFLGIEVGLSILAVVLAFTIPNFGSRQFESVERSFGKLAKRRALSVLVVGLAALALRAAVLPILPIPQPRLQDEFAYLLGADTFAHGRLTNPTPPMWKHFESQMIILRPTYASKYPPAQSLFLAAGQVLLGRPFWGVWLSLGLMCGAICWMLQAWLGEGWALLGGFLVVARMAAFSYWGDSYWGGAVAAIGGALVLGALPRLKQEHRVRNALLMGLGLAILANSRPYEGLVFSLPIAVALFAWMLGRGRPALSVSLQQIILPLCLLLGLTAAGMGYYNWRVTGNPLKLPYQVSQAEYDPAPYFLWQSPKPLPEYRHSELKQYETKIQFRAFEDMESPLGLAVEELKKATLIWLFFIGPLFTMLIVSTFPALPYVFSWNGVSAPSKFLLLVLGVSLAGIVPETHFYPHYAAPMACLFMAVVLLAMRRLRSWHWRSRPTGSFLVRSVPTLTIVLLLLRVGTSPLQLKPSKLGLWTSWFSHGSPASTIGREDILAELKTLPGRQLVLVRYSPTLYDLDLHRAQQWPPSGVWEWVYNRADINDQKVVWAQDMGPARNEKLIRYFGHVHAWLLYADHQPPKLVPYRSLPAGSGRQNNEQTTTAPEQPARPSGKVARSPEKTGGM
jgi:hypothetical protein